MFELILIGGILFFIFLFYGFKQIFSGKRNVLSKSIFQILLAIIIIVHTVIIDMAFEKKELVMKQL